MLSSLYLFFCLFLPLPLSAVNANASVLSFFTFSVSCVRLKVPPVSSAISDRHLKLILDVSHHSSDPYFPLYSLVFLLVALACSTLFKVDERMTGRLCSSGYFF